jgi:hypothetical protein
LRRTTEPILTAHDYSTPRPPGQSRVENIYAWQALKLLIQKQAKAGNRPRSGRFPAFACF